MNTYTVWEYIPLPGRRVERKLYEVRAQRIEHCMDLLRQVDSGHVPNAIRVCVYPPLPVTDGTTITKEGLSWVLNKGQVVLQ